MEFDFILKKPLHAFRIVHQINGIIIKALSLQLMTGLMTNGRRKRKTYRFPCHRFTHSSFLIVRAIPGSNFGSSTKSRASIDHKLIKKFMIFVALKYERLGHIEIMERFVCRGFDGRHTFN